MTFDPASVALGKKLGVVEDPRTFKLAPLLEVEALPRIPTSWRYASKLRTVPMFANDRFGDCTFARTGHRITAQEHSSQQREIALTDLDVLAGYSAVTGFDPARPETDNGAYMLDVENYMRRNGIGHEKDGTRHTIAGFTKVDHTDRHEVKAAINIFGGVAVGVWLPLSAQRQTGPNLIWHTQPGTPLTGEFEPGSWGGHAVEGVGYTTNGVQLYTWGREQFMSWSFWDAYVDECYAEISEDWLRGGKSPRGFDMALLGRWLGELG